jgi:hypothetical protein
MKMRTLLLAGCLLCSATLVARAQDRTSGSLLPVARDGKMGFADPTGKVVIEPRFSIPSFMGQKLLLGFEEGLARIKEHDKWGFIDQSGKVVIEPQFDEAGFFSEGFAQVKSKGKWGFIDKSGQFIAAPQFRDAAHFSEGLAPVALGDKWGFIDKTGQLAVKPQFDHVSLFKGGVASVRLGRQWSHINKSGDVVANCANECVSPFYEDLARVRTPLHFGVRPQYGYMNRKGEVVIKFQFHDAHDFNEGFALVKLDPNEERMVPTTNKFYFHIDRAGNRLYKETYFWADDFSEGMAAVQKGQHDKKGYIDATGRVVIPPRFDEAWPFTDGAALVRVGGKWGYVNKSGAFIWEPSK